MLTFVYDGNNVRFFEDAKELTPIPAVGQLRGTDSCTMRIGNLTTYWLNGRLDNIRIYDSAIPISQIREQYYSGLEKLLANGGITEEEYLDRTKDLANNH